MTLTVASKGIDKTGLYDTIMADYSNAGQAQRQALMDRYLKEQLDTYRKGITFDVAK